MKPQAEIIHRTHLLNLEAGEIATGQCDCACPGTTQTPAFPLPHKAAARYHRHPDLTLSSLDDCHYNAITPTSYGPAVLNASALALLNHFDTVRPISSLPSAWNNRWGTVALGNLINLGFLLPGDLSPGPPTETAQILSAYLCITESCNLACDYCYLPRRRADMSPETGRAAVDAAFRSALAHGYGAVKLKYAGGEPLLRFPLVGELHRYARALAERHGLALDGVVLSNGTLLTAEMVGTMLALGLRLMVSLDGLGAYHDCQRHFPGGRGSFQAAARAVEMALAHGLLPDISITVSGRNVGGLAELMSWVLERDLPFSLNFYRENDRSASHADLRLEEQGIVEGVLDAYKVVEANLPCRSLLASLADRANLAAPHLRPCSVGRSYLVFDQRGRVAKCQMDIGCTVASVHDSDPLARVRESADGVQNPSVDEKEECRRCRWRYWCAGGCPLTTYRAAGRYDVKSPNCNIYKALYPEVIRLEGLRLLQTSRTSSTQQLIDSRQQSWYNLTHPIGK